MQEPAKKVERSDRKKHQTLRRKKREMRVFVSSTFKDFKEEREQLIKKTFREVVILAFVFVIISYICQISIPFHDLSS